MTARDLQETAIQEDWDTNPRWRGVVRNYSAEDVVRLRGSVQEEPTLARRGAEKLWHMLQDQSTPHPYVNALGALTGGHAVQQVKAGIRAIYLSGWQVAADNNLDRHTYPDQSLYPANSVPAVVRQINNGFARADHIQWHKGDNELDYFAPIVADAEAGFGGILNAYQLMQQMITAGASGVHYEDQLSSAKKCGHMGGKVLVPTQEAINKLQAARLAADVRGVSTIVLARTDANAATLLTSDVDSRDQKFTTGERTNEGFYKVRSGLEQAIDRALSYAPYADLLWCETSTPDLDEAKRFADAVHAKYPEQMLAYNCSPSFNWKANLSDIAIASFQQELAALGYRFQFITLAGIHAMWHGMFDLARKYVQGGMTAYVELQEKEFADRAHGYTFSSHQQEVGAGYFDDVTTTAQGGASSVTALTGSTEEEQF